jgi:hypothetical protein
MKQYNKARGLKGIHTLLKQFNEDELTEWQRNLLRDRLLILSWYEQAYSCSIHYIKLFSNPISKM